jgi:transposase
MASSGRWPNCSRWISRGSDLTLAERMNALRSRTCLSSLMTPFASVSADGAYDTRAVYEAAHERGKGQAVRVLSPPGRDAQLSSHPSAAQQERDRNIRSIRELGRREWHTHSGYSKRSMVENTMYRYKTIIGLSTRSRSFDGQRVEVQLVSKIL